jgi:hypothetical protein
LVTKLITKTKTRRFRFKFFFVSKNLFRFLCACFSETNKGIVSLHLTFQFAFNFCFCLDAKKDGLLFASFCSENVSFHFASSSLSSLLVSAKQTNRCSFFCFLFFVSFQSEKRQKLFRFLLLNFVRLISSASSFSKASLIIYFHSSSRHNFSLLHVCPLRVPDDFSIQYHIDEDDPI